MHRHVTRCHLDLWQCPVLWCTVWKGRPQDCMDHIRGAHDVPREIKSASLEKYLPPWTVTRQVWTDSLTPRHSGISTDVLLFSDIGLSLVHHYRVHKRGLPYIAFSTELHVAAARSAAVAGGPADAVFASPRTSRRAVRRRRPVRVMESPMQRIPVLTVQDPLAAAGAGRWCSIVTPRCCQFRWTSVVWTCRRFRLRQCHLGPGSFLPNVSSCSVGGIYLV